MREPIVVEVEGDPRPQGSKVGFIVSGKVVMTEGRGPQLKLFRAWRKTVKAAAKEAMIGPLLTGPVTVDITFRLRRPMTVERAYPSIAPDLDKLTRAVFDSLTGTVWKDDSLVVGMVVRKLYAENQPVGATITVNDRS